MYQVSGWAFGDGERTDLEAFDRKSDAIRYARSTVQHWPDWYATAVYQMLAAGKRRKVWDSDDESY